MKRTEMVEYTICDVCETNHAWEHQACYGCGKNVCDECAKQHLIEMKSGVWQSGSRDLHVCTICYPKLLKNPTPLFKAALDIEKLRNEYKGWELGFEPRRKAAEKEYERLSEEHRANVQRR